MHNFDICIVHQSKFGLMQLQALRFLPEPEVYVLRKRHMAHKKKDSEKSLEVALLEARIRELELQNLALNTLIDVAERNGIEIRKKSGAKQ